MDEQLTKTMSGKDYDSHLEQFRESCLFRTHDADSSKLFLFGEKVKRFLLRTPQEANLRRVLERFLGNGLWETQFLRISVGQRGTQTVLYLEAWLSKPRWDFDMNGKWHEHDENH